MKPAVVDEGAELASVAVGSPTAHGGDQSGQEYVCRLKDSVRVVVGEHDNARLSAQVVRGSAPETLCSAPADAQLPVLGSHGQGRCSRLYCLPLMRPVCWHRGRPHTVRVDLYG